MGSAARRVRPATAVLTAVALVAALLASAPSGAGMAVAAAPRALLASTLAATCSVAGPATPTGSVVISGPMLPQITGSTLPVALPTTVTATSVINPGGTVTTTASFELDLAATAEQILTDRVKPAVAAAGYPQLVPTAWDVVTLHDLRLGLVLPPSTTGIGSPTAVSSQGSSSAAFSGGQVVVTIDQLSADTRTPPPAATFSVSWQEADGGAPAPRTLPVLPGSMGFGADVEVGVLFYGAPVVGGVTAPWSCTPDEPTQVLGSTEVVAAPVTTDAPPSTVPPTSSGATTAPSTTAAVTTTSWPSATSIPPSACSLGGARFDAYGGLLGVDLGATGYFRTARHQGRWWLVTPDGHPFFSEGVNHVTFDGTPDKNGVAAYRDAVTARYGTPANWADAELARLHDWGYNTLGAWSDTGTFGDRMPYTLLLDLTSENFGTGEMEDLWDPSWAAGVATSVDAAAAAHGHDPALLGYWSDNELHWGPDWRPLHLFDEYLARPASAAGKQAMVAWLQARYGTFAAFAADFTTTATDWTSLAQASTVTAWTSGGGQATRNAWVGVVAERYFSTIATALKAADPNHLFLGPRMIAQVAGTPLLQVARKYVDVASFNDYAIIPELEAPLHNADPTYLPVGDALSAQEAVLDKPILVSEWGFRAADSGLPNTWPPLFPVLQTQAQRAAAYERFARSLLDSTWVVGQHFFEFADEPPAGRSDGENSNFGLVDLHDDPYAPVAAVSATMHDCAYARLLSPTVTTTTAPDTAATTSAAGGGPSSTSTVLGTRPASAAEPVSAEPRYTG